MGTDRVEPRNIAEPQCERRDIKTLCSDICQDAHELNVRVYSDNCGEVDWGDLISAIDRLKGVLVYGGGR